MHYTSYSLALTPITMATIQVRISDEDKRAAEKILESLGLDLTTAVRIYVKKIVVSQGVPFPVRKGLTVNGFTPAFEEEVLATEKENDWSPEFDNAKAALTWLHASDDTDER